MLNESLWPRYFIGFDRMLANFTVPDTRTIDGKYPPYDIVKIGENIYSIEIAVAGFTKEEIRIEVKENNLTITGDASDRYANSNYVHNGIAKRVFERKFVLNDTVEVEIADLTNGVLRIQLKHNIPEDKRPRQITVN